MTLKRIARLILGLVFAGLFLWLIARQINFDDLLRAFADTRPIMVAAALIAFFVGYAARIERWRLMLQPDNSALRWGQCAGPLLASFAVNNVLPFRAGDVLRAFAFNARLGISSGIVLATLFVERLLDLLMVIVLLGVALAVFGLDSSLFAGIGSASLVAIALAIVTVLSFPQMFAPLARGIGTTAARWSPRLGRKLAEEIDKSLYTLSHLAKGHRMARLIIWSITVWLAEGCVFWFAALALSSVHTPQAGWLALPIGTLATLIPSTPGYVGTFDYFTMRAMTTVGNSPAAAAAFTLLVHSVLWLPPTLIGGMYLLLRPVQPNSSGN
jgi:hypothetical protein